MPYLQRNVKCSSSVWHQQYKMVHFSISSENMHKILQCDAHYHFHKTKIFDTFKSLAPLFRTSRLLVALHIKHIVCPTPTLMFGSFVKVSKKCQKSWFSGNGSARRAVNAALKFK